jgi:hypothetical protein
MDLAGGYRVGPAEVDLGVGHPGRTRSDSRLVAYRTAPGRCQAQDVSHCH